jgi:zinc protease
MRHVWMIALVALALPACESTPEVKPDPIPKEVVTLKIPELSAVPKEAIAKSGVEEFEVDGLKVILKSTPGRPVVSVRMYIAGGLATADPKTVGIEDLALKVGTGGGTKTTPRAEFKAALESWGSSIGGSSDRDYSSVSARTTRLYFELTWKLFAQTLTEPSFDAKEFELVKTRTIEGIRARLDDPDASLRVTATDVFFADHPYGFQTDGELETVEPLTVEALRAHYTSIVTRSRCTLVVVGDVSRFDLENMVKLDLAAMPTGAWTPVLPPELNVGAADLKVVPKEVATNYLLGYYAAPPPTHPDYFLLKVATSILADRLFEEVRTKRNLTYAVSAGLGGRQRNYGYLYTTAVDPKTTVGVMYDEVTRLQTEPIEAGELKDQLNVFLTEHYLGQETVDAQLGSLGGSEMIGGGWEQTLVFIDRVRAVTPADIQRVAQEYMRNVHWGYVGDPAGADKALLTSK